MFSLKPSKKQKLYIKSDIITFGQYKGDTVGYVMEQDPLYLEALNAKSSYFKLHPELKDELFLRCAACSECGDYDELSFDWGITGG